MTVLHASYEAGAGVSIAVPRRWLLLDVPTRHPIVPRLWHAVSTAEALDDVLDVLVADGIAATPSFAVLWCDADIPRAVLRGNGEIRVGADVSIAAPPGTRSWLETELAVGSDAFVLTVAAVDDGSAELPMASGVTTAGRVRIAVKPPGPSPRNDVVSPTVSPAEHVVEPVVVEPVVVEPAVVEPPAVEPSAGEPLVESAVEPAVHPAEPVTSRYDQILRRPPSTNPAPSPAFPEPSQAVGDAPEPPPDGDEASKGWPTRAPEVDDVEHEPVSADLLSAPTPTVAPPGATDRSDSAAVIQGVPWRSPCPPAPASVADPRPRAAPSLPPVSSPEPDEDDENEGTVSRTAVAAAVADLPASTVVLAGRCPAGHLTAAYSASCRVCGVSVPQQTGFEVGRPPLGILRLSTGDSVTLDRGVLLGRRPKTPPDGELPHLVRVESPGHDVSRQHAEIVLEGWNVYVRDLGSTNGTTVTLPGQPPRRLRDGEPELLEHGAVVVLADEVSCVFEVTP